MFLIFNLLLSLSAPLYADDKKLPDPFENPILETGFKGGLGVNLPDDKNAQVKHLTWYAQHPLGISIFSEKSELGIWWDSVSNRKSAAYFNYALGLTADNQKNGMYGEVFLGMAVISALDERLPLPFNFTIDMGVGMKDDRGRGIGLYYKHFSNGGLRSPNYGRDFVGLQVFFNWFNVFRRQDL